MVHPHEPVEGRQPRARRQRVGHGGDGWHRAIRARRDGVRGRERGETLCEPWGLYERGELDAKKETDSERDSDRQRQGQIETGTDRDRQR